MQHHNKWPKILSLLCLILGSAATLSLNELKDDPLFEYKPPKSEPVKVFAPKSVTDSQYEKPQDRNLVLDFFKDPNQVGREKQVIASVKKLTGLLEIADSFHNDPNYSVNVHVIYKNKSGNAALPEDYNKIIHSSNKARELTLKPSKPQLRSQRRSQKSSPLDMAIVNPVIIGEKLKSKFEFPKHFF